MRGPSIAIVLCTLVAAPAAWAGYAGGPVTGGGSISGAVTTTAKPSAAAMPVTKDHGTCGHSKKSEELVIGRGGALANAVVYLDRLAAGKPATAQTVSLDQVGCTYAPHVQAAVRGSQIELRSSDPILHNVHGALGGKDLLFNVAMPMKGQKIKKKLKKAGLVQITCDAGHTWMKAYVQVFDHPYFAVTGADGSYAISGVPAGTYTATFWHEKLGTKTAGVTVPASGEVAGNLVF